MTYSGVGVYSAYAQDNAVEGDEVSSTYEGRHLTFKASDLISPNALITKGYPVVCGTDTGDIVGVAFDTEVAGGDLIAIDTEGIWMLEVEAEDDFGSGSAVVAGDALFIDHSDLSCVISKRSDTEDHTLFGYALGNINSGVTAVIAVKIHWGPSVDNLLKGYGVSYTTGTTAVPRVYIGSDYTGQTGAHNVIEAAMSYLPDSDTGYGWHNTAAFKMTLGAGDTFTGGQGTMSAMSASLDFQNGATITQANGIFTAMQAVITSSGVPVYTSFEALTGLLILVLTQTDMSNKAGTYKSSGIALLNASDTAFMDAAIRVYGGAWDNLINFDGANRGGNEGIMHTSGGFSANGYLEASVLVDGTEHRIRIYKSD